MKVNNEEPRFLGTKDLARWIGRTPRYVQKLAAEKIIPSVCLPGRDRMFDREKVLLALSRFEEKEIGAAK
jgi:hypothetical protein